MADAGRAEFLAYCAERPLARMVPGAEHAHFIRWCSYEMLHGNRVVWHGEGMHAPASAVVEETPAPPPWEEAPGDELRIPATADPTQPAEEAREQPPSDGIPEPATPAEEAPTAPRSRRRRPVVHADDTAERLIAYTDGSGTRAHTPAGAGVVVLFDGAVVLEAARHLGNGTNNHAELSAVRVALAITDTPEWRDLVLLVRSDSEYTIGDTAREIAVRCLVHSAGCCGRCHFVGPLKSPNIVFTSQCQGMSAPPLALDPDVEQGKEVRANSKEGTELIMSLDNREPKPTVLDLFCGAGGLASGFQDAGYTVVGGIDYAESAVETFRNNIVGARGMVRDLRTGGADDIAEFVGGKVDVIVGGPSCQGFSTSGGLSRAEGRDQADPRNRLFNNYIDIVDHLRPSWIVFENVTGLLLYDNGRVALDIVRAFKEIGYALAPMILLAADYGVPQLRRRLIFVGNRTGSSIPFPAPTHGNPSLWKNYSLPFAHLSRIGQGGTGNLPHVTFGEACDDLPIVAEGAEVDRRPYEQSARTSYQREMRRHSTEVRQHAAADLSVLDRTAAQMLLPGQNWTDLPKDVLPARFSKIRQYDATTLLKRLREDQPAYTITTKFNEGTTGAFIHPTQARTISLREAARLQSFPDHFIFSGSAAQIRQQIGNAVPPLLGRCLAEAMWPMVMRDVHGVEVVALRDIVAVEINQQEVDPLKLHGARRKAKDSSIQPELF